MTWDTQVVNNHPSNVTVNGAVVPSGGNTRLNGAHDISIVVDGLGNIHLTDPGPEDGNFHQFVSTTWAVKVTTKANYLRYWGYEGGPLLVVTVNEDDTFSLPDQGSTSFNGIPISRPAQAQYAGTYMTNTQWYGGFFSPLTINDDGTVSVGPSDLTQRMQVSSYDSRNATLSLDWHKYKDTSFKTNFGLKGTGTSITLEGDLIPRPQDGAVHVTGALQAGYLSRADLERAIARYAPILQLHPNEQYQNCSIEYFLEHATLVDSKTGVNVTHPTAEQLPQGDQGDNRFWLTLEDVAKGGDLSTAKAYVHALWRPGLTYTDLQFWFFSAYNGPGTAHINGLAFDTIVDTSDVDLAPLGEHYGDWEYCVLRIDNSSKELNAIVLSQHSGSQFIDKSAFGQVHFRGEHPVIYSSKNGHANYTRTGNNDTEYHKFPPIGIPAGLEFSLINAAADGGSSLDCSKHYQVVSADWLVGDQAYPEPAWLHYAYRWGPEGTSTHMTASALLKILTAGAPFIVPLLLFVPGGPASGVAGLILAEIIVPYFRKDDLNGPGAPITKSSWWGNY